MNRSEIRNLVIENTRRTDKTTLMNLAINEALKVVSAERLWNDLMVEEDYEIEADDASVTLSDEVSRIIEGRLIVEDSPLVSRPLLIRPKSWIVQYFPAVSEQSTGKPVYAYQEGRSLYLVPISDGDYTIRLTYCQIHPEMDSDDDELQIRHAGNAVAAWATFWVFNALEQAENAAAWLTTYGMLVKTAAKIDGDNPAVKRVAQGRGSEPGPRPDYYLDPFVRRTPR